MITVLASGGGSPWVQGPLARLGASLSGSPGPQSRGRRTVRRASGAGLAHDRGPRSESARGPLANDSYQGGGLPPPKLMIMMGNNTDYYYWLLLIIVEYYCDYYYLLSFTSRDSGARVGAPHARAHPRATVCSTLKACECIYVLHERRHAHEGKVI